MFELAWTKEPPTSPGTYEVRDPGGVPRRVDVVEDENLLVEELVHDTIVRLRLSEYPDAEWRGPLTHPTRAHPARIPLDPAVPASTAPEPPP